MKSFYNVEGEIMYLLNTMFLLISSVGLLISLIIHVLILSKLAFNYNINYLFAALAIVYFPAMLIQFAKTTSKGLNFNNIILWNSLTKLNPRWIKTLIYILVGYSIITIVFCIVNIFLGIKDESFVEKVSSCILMILFSNSGSFYYIRRS
jgi:hypothetical protein